MTSRRPNLSLAGKRETPSTQSNSNRGATKRGRGRGRGRSDNNGSKRGTFKKPELIQTGGVFSEGLGGDFPSRKKERDADVYQFSFKRKEDRDVNEDSKKVSDKKSEENKDGKTSFKGWDELWESDEELDDAELRSICPKSFLSDLKRGTVMPYVLPREDETQFRDLLVKSSRLSLEEDDKMDIDEKKPSKNSVPSVACNSKTPEQLITMIEASTSDLIHLQLPSVIGSICQNMINEDENPENAMEIGESSDNITPEKVHDFALPNSRRIGKLQVTRKGRLLLQIGGYTVDLTCKPTQGKQQGAVLLETEPTPDPMMSPPAVRLSHVQNAVYQLGNVKHNLVGSMSWHQLNDDLKDSENFEENKHEKKKNEVNIIDPEYIKQIQEIEDVHKDWVSKSEKWSRGELDF